MRERTRAFLSHLEGVKELRGGTAWTAICPVHGGKNPHLDITEGREGIVAVCRSRGCAFSLVCSAIGMEVADTFWEGKQAPLVSVYSRTSRSRPTGGGKPSSSRSPVSRSPMSRKVTIPAVRLEITEPPAPNPEPRTSNAEHLEAEHIYRDAGGAGVINVRRYHRPDPDRPKGYKKACIPFRWEGGEWVKGLPPETPRLLYNLDLLTALPPGERVVWVEGENVADRLQAFMPTTTSLGGTGGKNKLPDLSPLKGRPVAILNDHDEPGLAYATHVLHALKAAGAKPYLKDLEAPPGADLPEGWDAIDLLDAGVTVENLLAALAPPSLNSGRFPLLSVRELLALKSPVWQVERFIQEQALFLLWGEPGNGKSFIGMDLLMCLAGPHSQWAGRTLHKRGPTVYINADGGGGFRDRVDAWYAANDASPDDYRFYTLNTVLPIGDPEAVAEFSAQLSLLPEPPVSIIVDTYSRCNAGKNENSQEEASMVVGNMDALREEYGCSVGLIHHGGEFPRGSTVLPGAIDASWKVVKTGGSIRATCVKQRNGLDLVPPLMFQLRSVPGRTEQVALYCQSEGQHLSATAQQEQIVLRFLGRHPDSTAWELQEHLGLSQPRTSEILNRLIKEGVVVSGPVRRHEKTNQGMKTFRLAEE